MIEDHLTAHIEDALASLHKVSHHLAYEAHWVNEHSAQADVIVRKCHHAHGALAEILGHLHAHQHLHGKK